MLIAPMGLWIQDDPVDDFFASSRPGWRRSLPRPRFAGRPGRRRRPAEGDALIEYHVERAKSMATAAKYLWPIPNRGLRKRLRGSRRRP